MIRKKSVEVKVGVVSLLATILLIFGIILGKGCNVSVSSTTLKIRFPNSGGIQVANPVVVNGVKRGSVSSVTNNNGSVIIEAVLDNIDDLKKDVTAKITLLEITGGKKIEINPGKSAYHFDPKNEIPGTTAFDLSDMVTLVGDLSQDAIVLFHRIDTLSARLNMLLGNENLAGSFNNIIANTDVMLSEARQLLSLNYDNINTTLKNISVLTTDLKDGYNKYEPRIDTMFSNLNLMLTSTKKLLGRADTSLTNVNFILTDLRGITSEVRNGDGFISKLLFDKTMSAKLDSTLINVDYLIKMIQENGVNVNIRLGTRP